MSDDAEIMSRLGALTDIRPPAAPAPSAEVSEQGVTPAPEGPESIADDAVAPVAAQDDRAPPSDGVQAEPAPAADGVADAVQAADDTNYGDAVDTIEIGGSLTDLAEHLGVDVADLYNHITVPVNLPDGRREVTLGEWKDGWTANDQATAAREQLTRERESFQQEAAAAQQRIGQILTESAAMADALQQAVLEPYQQVNWNQLREDDPSGYVLKRQEFQEAGQRAQAMRAAVQDKVQAAQRELQREQAQRTQQLLEREQAALVRAIPEFGTPEGASAEKTKMREYLGTLGFSSEEIDSAYDHRLIVMARKARLYDESQAGIAPIKKKVIKVAKKSVSPSGKADRATGRQQAVASSRAQLKKSGKVDDAYHALRALRNR